MTGNGGGRGERDALAWLNARLPRHPAGEVWIGDDAAVVAWPPSAQPASAQAASAGDGAGAGSVAPLLLLATDTVVGGIDADLELTTLADFGWKAMAVNLSDIAAMGGTPAHALVSVVGLGPRSSKRSMSASWKPPLSTVAGSWAVT